MKENLMNSAHKATNKQYRDGYDDIEWDEIKKRGKDDRKKKSS